MTSKPSQALIWIEANGSVRELTEAEKAHVDAAFSPFDGARPYIKSRYEQRDGWGEVSGYLPRSEVPNGVPINLSPPEQPAAARTPQEVAEAIRELLRKHESGDTHEIRMKTPPAPKLSTEKPRE
jgi:hypothetical protein